MQSAIYEGWVRHRRYGPVRHAFRYRLFMLLLDLAEVETVFRGRWLWSARRPAPAWFRRADHLGDPAVPLDEAVRRLVAGRTGQRPAGPVRLLTHLRYFGYGFNPISVYYLYRPDGETLDGLVAEVSNTPWGERHCYVLPGRGAATAPGRVHHRFAKAFHVSPFMGMAQTYALRGTAPAGRLLLHLENHEDGRVVHDATLHLRRRALSGPALASVLVRYPFMTGRVIAGIYAQALRLWLKGAPYHSHPAPTGASAGEARP